MEVLPFTCPKKGHDFKKSPPIADRRPYACPCGEVVLSCTVLDYLEPVIDKDGKRARLVYDLIAEAWKQNIRSPYINAPTFDRRLAQLKQRQSFWRRLLGSD